MTLQLALFQFPAVDSKDGYNNPGPYYIKTLSLKDDHVTFRRVLAVWVSLANKRKHSPLGLASWDYSMSGTCWVHRPPNWWGHLWAAGWKLKVVQVSCRSAAAVTLLR